MTTRNDGGPAFSGAPQGMVTVRDYFAAQALAGMLVDTPELRKFLVGAGEPAHAVAKAAYAVADAMLQERDK